MQAFLKHIITALLLSVSLVLMSQNSADLKQEADLEAKRQTEILQNELGLSAEQAKAVYDINLKYATGRKQASTRSDAMDQLRKKDDEINKVLNQRQKSVLMEKRMQSRSVEIDGKRNYLRTNSSRSSGTTMQDNPLRRSGVDGDRPVRSGTRSEAASQNRNSSGRENVIRNSNRPVRENKVDQRQQRSSSSVSNRERSDASRSNPAVNRQQQTPPVRREAPPARNNSRPTRR